MKKGTALLSVTVLIVLAGLATGCGKDTKPSEPEVPGESKTEFLDARLWVPSSVPLIVLGAYCQSVGMARSNGECIRFNPYNVVQKGDLWPLLTREEGALDPVDILALWVPQKWVGAEHDSLWFGCMRAFENGPIDLSSYDFIEVWVNDFRDFEYVREPGVRLCIDLGVVSEDAQRYPDEPPNGMLDTEDMSPRDGVLDATEDTGLDSVFSNQEMDVAEPTARISASVADPHGDDWQPPDLAYELERDPRSWRYSTGTERNQTYRSTPDTEDLDGNGRLDLAEHVFRYVIFMPGWNHLDTDVYEEYLHHPDVPFYNTVKPDNGWRRFLIPLDSPREIIGTPYLSRVQHIRIWVDGMDDLPPLIMDPQVFARPTLEFAEIRFGKICFEKRKRAN